MVLSECVCGSEASAMGGGLVGGDLFEDGVGFLVVGVVRVTTGVGGLVWVPTVHVSRVVVWTATAHVGLGDGGSVWVEASFFERRISIRDWAYSSTCSLWASSWSLKTPNISA